MVRGVRCGPSCMGRGESHEGARLDYAGLSGTDTAKTGPFSSPFHCETPAPPNPLLLGPAWGAGGRRPQVRRVRGARHSWALFADA